MSDKSSHHPSVDQNRRARTRRSAAVRLRKKLRAGSPSKESHPKTHRLRNLHLCPRKRAPLAIQRQSRAPAQSLHGRGGGVSFALDGKVPFHSVAWSARQPRAPVQNARAGRWSRLRPRREIPLLLSRLIGECGDAAVSPQRGDGAHDIPKTLAEANGQKPSPSSDRRRSERLKHIATDGLGLVSERFRSDGCSHKMTDIPEFPHSWALLYPPTPSSSRREGGHTLGVRVPLPPSKCERVARS